MRRALESLSANMTWVEAEIVAAKRRHPAAADPHLAQLRPA
jgi:hypothetical protein